MGIPIHMLFKQVSMTIIKMCLSSCYFFFLLNFYYKLLRKNRDHQ